VLVTVVIDGELILGLFYLVLEIKFNLLLVCLLLNVDLSLTTVLLIIQSFILIHSVISSKTA